MNVFVWVSLWEWVCKCVYMILNYSVNFCKHILHISECACICWIACIGLHVCTWKFIVRECLMEKVRIWIFEGSYQCESVNLCVRVNQSVSMSVPISAQRNSIVFESQFLIKWNVLSEWLPVAIHKIFWIQISRMFIYLSNEIFLNFS